MVNTLAVAGGKQRPLGFLSLLGLLSLSLYQLSFNTKCIAQISDASAAAAVAGIGTAAQYGDMPLMLQRDRMQRQQQQQQQAGIRSKEIRPIPLLDLVNTSPDTCPPSKYNMSLYENVILDSHLAFYERDPRTGSERRRKIPRLIHFTSKSACMHASFVNNLKLWHFQNYSTFLHNDAAMDRFLFDTEWPEFPHLTKALQCSVSPTSKTDLWRALIVYEYGGIYSDIDNKPNLFFNGGSILHSDEAFFVVETGGFLSQYFFAAAPRHPLLYLQVQFVLHRLYEQADVDQQYIPFVTGPGALKNAFIHFMGAQDKNSPDHLKHIKHHEKLYQEAMDAGNLTAAKHYKTVIAKNTPSKIFQKVFSGFYVGLNNWTVTVKGRRGKPQDWVARGVVKNKKEIFESEMNMTHYTLAQKMLQSKNESCLQRLYRKEPASVNGNNNKDSIFEQYARHQEKKLLW